MIHIFNNKRRNVIDQYQDLPTEEIKAELDKKRHPFATLCCNLEYNINIGTIVRTSNAFLSEEVFIYGRKQWDRRGAVGTHNYSNLNYIKEESGLDNLSNYTIVGVDNTSQSIPVEKFIWPDRPLMCFGNEKDGLPEEVLKRCENVVHITQYGSVRSLNVACAAAIVMYDFVNKFYEK